MVEWQVVYAKGRRAHVQANASTLVKVDEACKTVDVYRKMGADGQLMDFALLCSL